MWCQVREYASFVWRGLDWVEGEEVKLEKLWRRCEWGQMKMLETYDTDGLRHVEKTVASPRAALRKEEFVELSSPGATKSIGRRDGCRSCRLARHEVDGLMPRPGDGGIILDVALGSCRHGGRGCRRAAWLWPTAGIEFQSTPTIS